MLFANLLAKKSCNLSLIAFISFSLNYLLTSSVEILDLAKEVPVYPARDIKPEMPCYDNLEMFLLLIFLPNFDTFVALSILETRSPSSFIISI